MKKLSLRCFAFLLFCIPSTTAFAQGYASTLGQNLTTWNICFKIPDATFTDSIVTRHDTTVGAFTYKVIYHPVNAMVWGYYREDSLAEKAWFMDAGGHENLVMDLSLSVGDTFWVYDQWSGPSPTLVDSVYLDGNGRKRVRMDRWQFVAGAGEPLAFIEGVGPNAGIDFMSGTTLWGNSEFRLLLCAAQDSVQSYANTIFGGNCNIVSIGIDKGGPNIGWRVFPNPLGPSERLSLEGLEEGTYTAELMDVQGRTVRRFGAFDATAAFEIDRNRIPAGCYHLVLRDANGWSGVRRVVLE